MKLICAKFKDGKCSFYKNSLRIVPTGVDKNTGECNIGRHIKPDDWIYKGSIDCNKIDLEGREI